MEICKGNKYLFIIMETVNALICSWGVCQNSSLLLLQTCWEYAFFVFPLRSKTDRWSFPSLPLRTDFVSSLGVLFVLNFPSFQRGKPPSVCWAQGLVISIPSVQKHMSPSSWPCSLREDAHSYPVLSSRGSLESLEQGLYLD